MLRRDKAGFTLIEVIIDIAIIGLVTVAVFSSYTAANKMVELAKSKIAAVALANEKMEEIRNMPYDNLATEHGPIVPSGNILDDQVVDRKGIQFNVHIVISYVDDPYDGCADIHQDGVPDSICLQNMPAGKPVDLYPYDYKKAEITVSKIGLNGYQARLTSNIAAKAAETPSNSGIIKLCVIDAVGNPIPEANVTITNPDVSPPVNISATTGLDGCIMVPNLPPNGQNQYHLTASKTGYSFDSTTPRTPQNPNEEPYNPDVDVQVQKVTSQTLIIDLFSTLKINFTDENNNPLPNLPFHLEGSKKIYFNPTTYKYSQDLTADANGYIELPNMEFDNYTITIPGRNIIATIPYQPVDLQPNSILSVKVISTTSATIPRLFNCEPNTGKTGETTNATITGDNFIDGLSVKLVSSSGVEINGQNVVVSQGKTIEADFNLTGASTGLWDILITNPNGESVRQTGGFEVKTQ